MNLKTLRYNAGHIFRRKLWFSALVFVVFLFALPINAALQLQRYSGNWLESGAAERAQTITTLLERILSFQSLTIIVLMIIAAFAASQCFFHYLHSKKEIDFFHSLPIRRGNLFASHYIAGVMAVFLPYLINLLLTILAVVAMDCGNYLDFAMVAEGFGIHLLYFLSIFSLGTLAAVLSGNAVVQGLLTITFCSIGPVLIGCYQWVRTALQPAWYDGLTDWSYLIANSSPVTHYFCLYANYLNSDGKLVTPAIVNMLLFTLLIVLAAWLLYRLRPSETAGRALAFPVSRPIVKYPVMLCAMAGFAMTMHEIGDVDGYGWFFVGVVLGGFLSAQIMEIIYRFDFQGIRKKLLPLALAIVLFSGVSLCLIQDVGNYNAYVPETDDVLAVDVRIDGLSPDAYNDYISNREYVEDPAVDNWLHVDGDDFLLRGHTEDSAAIVAVCGIAQGLVDAGMENYNTPKDKSTVAAIVRYYLKDGSVKTRQYEYSSLPLSQVEEQVLALYADDGFRNAQYALFEYDFFSIRLADISAFEGNDYDYYGILKDDLEIAYLQPADATTAYGEESYDYYGMLKRKYLNQDISSLLQVYENELKALDGEDRMRSLPIGKITFYVFAADPGEIEADDIYALEKSHRVFTYPIYPEFTETIALLEEIGFDNWELDPSLITSITIDCYNGQDASQLEDYGILLGSDSTYEADWYNQTFTDPDEIAAIWEATAPYEALYLNGFQDYLRNCDVSVYIEDAGNGYSSSYYRVFLKE